MQAHTMSIDRNKQITRDAVQYTVVSENTNPNKQKNKQMKEYRSPLPWHAMQRAEVILQISSYVTKRETNTVSTSQ